jgi:hypothetical protein
MDRRGFLGASLGAAAGLGAAGRAAAASDQDAVKQRLVDWYRAFANPKVDRAYYRSFTTDDYLLCEHGELLDKAGDEKLLDATPPDQQRVDRFDFRRVTIEGDRAWLVYFLEADIEDGRNGRRTRRWLESAAMRRAGGVRRFELLHSTRINPPA